MPMPPISLKAGMLIIHPWHPRWGPGKIVHIDGRKAYVFFRDNLQRKAATIDLLRTRVRFPMSQSDPVLDRLPKPEPLGSNWVLPDNFQQQMVETDVRETELAIRRGIDQARIGRILLASSSAAISHLRAMWMTLESDCYEISPDGESHEAKPLEVAIAAAAPAFAQVQHEASIPTIKPWLVGLSDEFLRLATGIAFEQQAAILEAIAQVAASPMVAGDSFAWMGDTQLWLHRRDALRLVYKPDDDARSVVFFAIAPPVARFA